MQKQFIRGLVRKIAENKYRVLASTSSVDRQGDSIDQSGWILGNYEKNPVMLWAHNYDELPVAKATKIEITPAGLELEFEFAPAEANPKAAQIKMLYDEGFLNAVSVGFIAQEQNGNIITRAELLEVSFVPVPANQDALRRAVETKSIDLSLIEKEIEKGAVAQELDAVEATEAKYEKWEEVVEVISAFWTVYFDEATPVESFAGLLREAVALLNLVADQDGIDEDDMKSVVGKAISPETTAKFLASFEEKAGRELSNKNTEKIKAAMGHIMQGHSVLDELCKSTASSDEGDGKALADTGAEGGVVLTAKEFASLVKANAIANDKQNEVVLGLVKKFIAQRN